MAKNITAMAVPMIIAQLINVLYNITDRFFIGRIGGGQSLSLTGVGIVFPIINIITAFTNLFGMGGALLCSIARGRKDDEAAERIIGSSFFMLIITALVLTLIGVVFQDPLLRLFGASSETFPYAKEYFSVYIWGTAASVIGLGMNNFINCQGFGKVGMVSIAAGAVINVILDPLLIFVLDLGVRGAAIATVVAQLVSAVWVLHFLTGRRALLLLRKEHIRWQPAVLLQTVQMGFANFVMAFTNGITQFAYNRALMNLGGDVFVGAMTVITSVREMVIMPVHGITAGSQPVLGYNYGAQKLDRVKKGIAFTTGVCIVYTAVVWGVLFLFPQAAILLFTDDLFLGLLSNGTSVFRTGHFHRAGKGQVCHFLLLVPQGCTGDSADLAASSLYGGIRCVLVGANFQFDRWRRLLCNHAVDGEKEALSGRRGPPFKSALPQINRSWAWAFLKPFRRRTVYENNYQPDKRCSHSQNGAGTGALRFHQYSRGKNCGNGYLRAFQRGDCGENTTRKEDCHYLRKPRH